ncbi:MAG: nucleoside hydrolase [Satyrvirus sp.]|uniref:Nucleoside hydrolase n=1 Tax=Satyrvirus sp. TaxID=2487771 RepID=A0A3G5ADZ4_9VIRU|nr:MAG: nucleoside hydrolase [Satyrvirus sp.]
MDLVLITDPGSVDPDDILTLFLLTQLNINIKAVVATHHYPTIRAKVTKLILTKLGRPDIPVYVGNGVEYSEIFDKNLRNKFLSENEKFPNLFGLPAGVHLENEYGWFPNFMKPYYKYFSKEIDEMKIETNYPEFINNLLSDYNPKNKLTIVCIAPMHDLLCIDEKLYPNMDLYAMGGGFFKSGGKNLVIEKIGYNWGICPGTTNQVLQILDRQKVQMTLISSGFVRNHKINLPLNIYHKWINMANSGHLQIPPITKAFFEDWLNCNEGNLLTSHKNLCDPITLLLAVTKEFKFLTVQTTINMQYLPEFEDYLSIVKDKQMIEMHSDNYGNTKLVYDINENLVCEMIKMIEMVLFPNICI